jgi:hypothetical protein
MDPSTQFANLYVATENAELNDKLASYTADQKVCVIRIFYSSGGYFVAVCCVTIEMEVCIIGEPCDIQGIRTVLQERSVLPRKSVRSRYSIFRQWLTQLHFARQKDKSSGQIFRAALVETPI